MEIPLCGSAVASSSASATASSAGPRIRGELEFELANRAFFATAISDRGDAYFEHFSERHNELVAEQEAGIGAFYLLVDGDASVLGRFNLTFGPQHTATLGYRVAQHSFWAWRGNHDRARAVPACRHSTRRGRR